MPRLRPLAALICVVATNAPAVGFQVESRTEAQAYAVRSFRDTDPTQPSTFPRRRLVQYLGLEAYELITGEPIGFESSLRLFADFGLPPGEAARIDGARGENAELINANVHYHGEAFSFRIGRQNYTDMMDLMSFDGASFRYVTSWGLGAEVYGGLWVKASSPLGSSVYQPDGIRESDIRRVSSGEATPYVALDDIEPLVGAKLLLEKLGGFSASAGFRQSWLSGQTDIRRAALEAKWLSGQGFNVYAGAEYDLVSLRVSNLRAMAHWSGESAGLTAEVMRVTPVLSADSIWLYFLSTPHSAARARLDLTPGGRLRYWVQATGDLYENTTNLVGMRAAVDASSGLPIAVGGDLGISFQGAELHASADATFKTGWGGRQEWLNVTGGWAPESAPVSLDARFSFANVADAQNALLAGNFVGAQAWGSYFFTKNAKASLVVEENLNAVTRSDTKVFLMLDWKASF